MRFASHRDVARAMERGVRRAGLPIAYSAGFTPHPKISYAGAAPTGMASEAEYLELSLTRRYGACEVRDLLDAALPDGIDVIEVTEDPAALGGLQLEASLWRVVLPGVPEPVAARAVAEFLSRDSVEVERATGKGTRVLDARCAVLEMASSPAPAGTTGHNLELAYSPDKFAAGQRPQEGSSGAHEAGNAEIRMVVRHVEPAVRPDDIVAALNRVAAVKPSSPPVVTRLAQGAADVVLERALLAPGRDVAADTVKTARAGASMARGMASGPADACDLFPRGAEAASSGPAPGNLTGDNPHARERAQPDTIPG